MKNESNDSGSKPNLIFLSGVAIDQNGNSHRIYAEDEKQVSLDEFSLSTYPNPFNPSTSFSVNLPTKAVVSVKIYDLLGREIWSLTNKKFQPGIHKIIWNGKNLNGISVPSGLYLANIEVNGKKLTYRKSVKITMMK